MKITKRQLRRIIKEEKARLLSEANNNPYDDGTWTGKSGRAVGNYPRDTKDWVEALGQLIDQDLTSRGVWYEQEGDEVIKALEILRREIKDAMRGPTR